MVDGVHGPRIHLVPCPVDLEPEPEPDHVIIQFHQMVVQIVQVPVHNLHLVTVQAGTMMVVALDMNFVDVGTPAGLGLVITARTNQGFTAGVIEANEFIVFIASPHLNYILQEKGHLLLCFSGNPNLQELNQQYRHYRRHHGSHRRTDQEYSCRVDGSTV